MTSGQVFYKNLYYNFYMLKKFFTYIVECADGTYYIGYTVDLKKRLRQHNGEITGGAWYTSWKKPVFLVYTEEFETKSLAMKREHALKKLKRKQKEMLINLRAVPA
jgi:putative endonuclease